MNNAKTKCVSCSDSILPKDYNENGNYCARCCAMCGAMAKVRIMSEYFLLKTCQMQCCRQGYYSHVDKRGNLRQFKCEQCLFNKYSPEERQAEFNSVFKHYNRPELLFSDASIA